MSDLRARFFQGATRAFKSSFKKLGRQLGRIRDFWLIGALLVGFLLGLQGLNWGHYDCLNLDKMAFKNLFAKDRAPFQPASYVKPPFYTYLNHFVARIPAMTISSMAFWKPSHERYEIFLRGRLWLARVLNLLLFAGCTIIIFVVARQLAGDHAARLASWLWATSAGWVPYQIFLTTDLAVVFFMLGTFYFATKIVSKPTMQASIMGGLFAGLAGATKYNGLAVAAVLPVAHLLASHAGNRFLNALKRPSAWICGIMVPVGFVIGNPFCIFDRTQFWADFSYNYNVTPIYNGVTSGTGYGEFGASFLEIFGWPGTVLLCLGVFIGTWHLAFKKVDRVIWFMAFTVLGLYAWKIGSFPRMETRFVLPAAPFLLILAAPGFQWSGKCRFFTSVLFSLVISYNILCGVQIGGLFRLDPRNRTPDFVKQHFSGGETIEWSKSVPKIEALPKKAKIHEIKTGLERAALFEKMFENDRNMRQAAKEREPQVPLTWFSKEERVVRSPEFVFWCSIDVEGITEKYYQELFDKNSGYQVVYDASSPILPWWAYPQKTEFLKNRMTIWQKSSMN